MKHGGVSVMILLGVVWAASAGAAPRASDRRESPLSSLEALPWLGSEAIAPRDLRGRVTLLEFWTFDCINCRRTIPAMKRLAADYRGTDVVVLSVHTPELDHERVPANVRRAAGRMNISYPVALDHDFKAWRAFGNRYWPALYLVDRSGVVRFHHIGELHEGTPSWTGLIRRIEALRGEPASGRSGSSAPGSSD